MFDERLILQIARGDAEAFRQVYEATDSAVYGFALSILGNRHDAEDVMHDTYIRMAQGAAAYQPMGRPLAWLLTIVRRLCYNKLRARKPELSLQEPETLEVLARSGAASGGSSAAETSADRRILEEALVTISEEERQIVILHAVTGMKHREIAELLGLPLSTVLSKYRRALKKLRNAMEEGSTDGSEA